MSKRGAEKQLTHENWDNSDDEEAAGQFQQANEQVLKTRVIKRARRRVNRGDQQAAAASPFAAFSGFGAAPKPSANTNNLFSFLSKPAGTDSKDSHKPVTEAPSEPALQSPQEVSRTTVREEEKENMSGSPVRARPSIHRSGETGAPAPAAVVQPSEYHRQLIALNRCLLSWVQQHVQNTPLCILSPVFRDYEAHLSRIQKKYGGVAEPSAEPTAVCSAGMSVNFGVTPASQGTSAPTTNFKFGTSADRSSTPKTAGSPSSGFSFGVNPSNPSDSGKTPQATGFSFGHASAKPSDTSKDTPAGGGGFSFGMSTTKTAGAGQTMTSTAGSGFSFGLPSSSPSEAGKQPSAASGGFSFGTSAGAAPPATTSTAGFSFGFSAVAKPAVAAESAQEANESEEPPVVQVKPVQEEDAIYSKRCKLFYNKDGAYVEKGVGVLHLKPCSDDKFQCLIRADTNLGNILLNIKLSKSIPTQRMGKNNVMMACVPNPPLDPKLADAGPVPLLIRVKTSDDADQLLQQLDEHKR